MPDEVKVWHTEDIARSFIPGYIVTRALPEWGWRYHTKSECNFPGCVLTDEQHGVVRRKAPYDMKNIHEVIDKIYTDMREKEKLQPLPPGWYYAIETITGWEDGKFVMRVESIPTSPYDAEEWKNGDETWNQYKERKDRELGISSDG